MVAAGPDQKMEQQPAAQRIVTQAGGRPGEGGWEYTPASLALANEKNGVLRNEINAFLKEEGVAISITPLQRRRRYDLFHVWGVGESQGSTSDSDRRHRGRAV